MKKEIPLIMILIGVLGLMSGYYTMGLFTDSSSTEGNSFSTGTIEINSYRGGFDTISDPMFYTSREEGNTLGIPAYEGCKPTGLWMPGKSVIRSLLVYNGGNMDAAVEQVKADILEDNQNLAAEMVVKIYKVYPQSGDVKFQALQGDDTDKNEHIDFFTRSINRNILNNPEYYNHFLGINQEEIETAVEINEVLWEGSLYELCSGYKYLETPIYLKACEEIDAFGCILAFQVSMNPEAGNEYQGTVACFDFTIKASQSI